jgi:formylglycine-generating enzyme
VTYTDGSYPATVSHFRLDKYEVTVGRFRKFVDAWSGGWRPTKGDGKHVHLNGGKGLVDSTTGATYEPGWDLAWNAELPSNKAYWDQRLLLEGFCNWTSSAGSAEHRPISCVTWYDAYAFCIWDGGFLPSEAEWNYAAAGGSEQRVFPWSSPATSTTIDCTYANYHTGPRYCYDGANDVGSESPKGDGRWGQSDLAGNVQEFTLDWYSTPYEPTCDNCAYLDPASGRVSRGGGWEFYTPDALHLRAAFRDPASGSQGFRCARSAP